MSEVFNHCLMFAKGAFTGFAYNFIGIAAALFITNFVMQEGKGKAFIGAIGLSITNIFWAILSAYTLSFAISHLNKNIHVYTFFGSLILLYFAYKIYFKKDKARIKFLPKAQKSEKIYLESTLFGLTSPEKIIGYAALFTLINIPKTQGFPSEKIPLVIGVGIGSLLWWVIYIYFVHGERFALSEQKTKLLQKGSAYFFAALSVIGLCSSLVQWYIKA